MDCRDKPGNDRGKSVDNALSIVIPAKQSAEPGSGSPGLASIVNTPRPGSPIPDSRSAASGMTTERLLSPLTASSE